MQSVDLAPLPWLCRLTLSRNCLTVLPSALSTMCQLQYLSAHTNSLTSMAPLDFRLLSNLSALDVKLLFLIVSHVGCQVLLNVFHILYDNFCFRDFPHIGWQSFIHIFYILDGTLCFRKVFHNLDVKCCFRNVVSHIGCHTLFSNMFYILDVKPLL